MSYKIEESEDTLIISLSGCLAAAEVQEFEVEMKNWLLNPAKAIVLNLKDVIKMEKPIYRPVLALNQILKKNSKHLFSINCSASLVAQLKQDGVVSVFNPVNGLAEVKSHLSPKPKGQSLDVKFISPFIVATQNTLATQANVKLKAGQPFIKATASVSEIAIAGVISISSPRFSGSVALCFPAKVFLQIYERIVGEKITEISDESQDAVGEILNIIYGQAKSTLNKETPHTLEMAIPTVLVGENLKIRSKTTPVIVLPFESDCGNFQIEINVNPTTDTKAA